MWWPFLATIVHCHFKSCYNIQKKWITLYSLKKYLIILNEIYRKLEITLNKILRIFGKNFENFWENFRLIINKIEFNFKILKFSGNFQENFLEIWKKVERIFSKFWVNFTLRLTKFLSKFMKFWNKLWKGQRIFINSWEAQDKIKTWETTDN